MGHPYTEAEVRRCQQRLAADQPPAMGVQCSPGALAAISRVMDEAEYELMHVGHGIDKSIGGGCDDGQDYVYLVTAWRKKTSATGKGETSASDIPARTW